MTLISFSSSKLKLYNWIEPLLELNQWMKLNGGQKVQRHLTWKHQHGQKAEYDKVGVHTLSDLPEML